MRIMGTGSALPKLTVTNDMLSAFLDTDDAWIRTRTGITERRVLSSDTLDDLAIAAAKHALESASVGAGELDMILCSCVQSPYVTPAMACVVAGAVGAQCPAVDINGACAGFLYGLDMAEAYLKSGRCRRILLVCAENMSRMVDWTKRDTCILFGDGAGAVVLGEGDALKAIRLTCAYDKEPLCCLSPTGNSPYISEHRQESCLHMNGQDVFKFAVSQSSADIKTVVADAGESIDAVAYFLLHQANMRIIQAVSAKLKQPEERFPHNLERLGNTSSASIPILLDEMHKDGRLHAGDTLVFSAFGAGLVTGACVLKWQS